MKRILIIGSGGAGKSTFARELGALLGLPVIHLDQLYWKPGWEKPEKAEWARIVDRVTAQHEWVMDGNFGGTLPQRLKRADTVILLDISRWICLWRVARRFVRYRGRQRPDMTPGCHERFDREFIRWIWNYPSKSRPAKLALLSASGPDQRVVILTSTGDIRRFLEETRREVELRRLSAALAAKG
ncbi:MAG TPA: DNA topology modulation protein [Gemmatimonadaceae bacterium]|nr:DNA topology modulation protein [Gemmatimonadaceae bacterium]